jgi:midasin
METIAAMCHNGINRTDVLEFSALLQKTENPFVKDAFSTHLCPILTRSDGADSSSNSWEWLGDAWISLSLCLIHLYVPDGPLDPLIVQECERNHFISLERRLRNQMEVIRNMEELVTGNGSNKTLHELARRLRHVEDRLSSVGLSPVHRVSDVTRLNSLFQEISQFSAQILSRLPSLPPSNQNPKSPWASNAEVVLQGTISGFIQRLESGYADLHDIVHPLVWSLNQLRLGLRIGVYAREVPRGGEQEEIAHALLAFPSVEAVRRSRLIASIATPLPDVEWTLHCIAGINYQAVTGSKLENQSLELKHRYDFMLSLWLQDREKERQEMIDSSSLYRQRKHDETIVDDAEAEEQDFHSMFPQFEDESLPVYHVKSRVTPGARFVSGPQMLELARMHGFLFQSSRDPHYPSLASYRIRRRLAVQRQCAQGQLAVLSPILDDVSLCWRLSLLSDRIGELDTTDLNYSNSYDFYTDSNVPEVRKAISVLKELRARLQSIILEWPDQMVLQNLLERVQKILDLALQTPVAGVLGSLERLLMHTDDWESYANRENTLKPHQQKIIELIVGWRRLELRCWAQLLAVQEQIFIDGTSEWWFRLYELLVQGTIAASEAVRNGATQALDEHVSRLTPLLDEYMTSSPLGQFRPRLNLLQSFARYLDLIAIPSEKPNSVALKRLARIAHTVTKHYEYALPAIMDDLTRGRAPLEKDIRDYIKLASWKDVNVFALKQSAERTHRQLHKCIRKFRDILRAPINPSHFPRLILDDTNLVVLESIERPHPVPELSALPSIDTRGDGPKHLKHLSLTLERFTNVLGDGVLALLKDEASQFVDALAIQTITTAQSLADAPITGSAEEKQKATKTLVMRKRRALMDLLKEMKRIGVPPNLKSDLLAQQQSRSHLLESGVLVDGFDPNLDAVIKKGNLYYHRLINGLQFVRDALHSHHSDLSTRELQRTLMFTESTFSYGYSLRQKYVLSFEIYESRFQPNFRTDS